MYINIKNLYSICLYVAYLKKRLFWVFKIGMAMAFLHILISESILILKKMFNFPSLCLGKNILHIIFHREKNVAYVDQ